MFLFASRRLRRSTLVATMVLTGSGVLAMTAPPSHAQQAVARCPYAFFYRNGLCYPYSWSGIEGPADVDRSGLSR